MGMDQRIFKRDRVEGIHLLRELLEWRGTESYLAFLDEQAAGANGSYTPIDGELLRRVAERIEPDEPDLVPVLVELAERADAGEEFYYEWDN